MKNKTLIKTASKRKQNNLFQYFHNYKFYYISVYLKFDSFWMMLSGSRWSSLHKFFRLTYAHISLGITVTENIKCKKKCY